MIDEVALLVAACGPASSPARLAELGARPLDWAKFVALTRRHRVQGLVQRGLKAAELELPALPAATIREDARQIAQRNLLFAAETARLCTALSHQDVLVIVLKGVALGILAHGSIAPKMSWDIDLLVTAERLAAAAEVLTAAGYQRAGPTAEAVALADWHRFAKDSTWRHAQTGISVELHTELTESPDHLLAGIDATAPVQNVAISPGVTVPTLGDDHLFAYLAVHGAISGWRRLKWLADFAGLIQGAAEADLAHRFTVARSLGAERAAAQALVLSARFFGTPLPAEATAAASADWKVRTLVAWAARIMTDPDGYDGADDTVAGTIPLHVMLTFLVPGLAYKQSELRRRLRRDPRANGPLPYTFRRIAERLRGAKPH